MLAVVVSVAFGGERCAQDSSDPTCLADQRSLLAMRHQKGMSGQATEDATTSLLSSTDCYKNEDRSCRGKMKSGWPVIKTGSGGVTNFRDNCLYRECEEKGMMWNKEGDMKWHWCNGW